MTRPDSRPILVWIRRDLRLADNPALLRAAQSGQPVIPVFLRDAGFDQLGAAAAWRFGLGLEVFDQKLRQQGSRLILRSGAPEQVFAALMEETGARTVYWNRAYDPDSIARDTTLKQGLRALGQTVESFPGNLIWEPWQVETGQGGAYRVYSPFWRAVSQKNAPPPLPQPDRLVAPTGWPWSERIEDWHCGQAMQRGADVVRPHLLLGEQAAWERLQAFLGGGLSAYADARDMVAQAGTSGLSEPLAYGEISPRQIWHSAKLRAAVLAGRGPEVFCKELVWREFAYHLMFHFPHMLHQPWRDGWEAFPWLQDSTHPFLAAWQQGRTGVEIVDAGQRELYVTGRMHNRVRMITASYLCKHLMLDWRLGLAWFADCLVDWDPASNAMGWQWVAGCGPDAAPFFRIFNPQTQAQKFDPLGGYRNRWLVREAEAFFAAAPPAWQRAACCHPSRPIVALDVGRKRALEAYKSRVS